MNVGFIEEPEGKVSVDERRVLERCDDFGIAASCLSADMSIYHPWVGDVWLKPMRFDLRNSLWVGLLWAKGPRGLGRHRHCGPVSAYTIEGRWRHSEYDWLAQPGDFIQENPGAIHTLSLDVDTKILLFVQGAVEFYDDDHTIVSTMDTFALLDKYIAYCDRIGGDFRESLVF